ncbi:MAG TPA: metal ABC transporter substrate-binding protein [Gemmatimonadales bacterium]|nr:metal ABC transporter substrate-binding protein [Gemmatimonadales bacterium]
MSPYIRLLLSLHVPGAHLTADPVKVVTSLTTYAAIAREIVGDRGEVSAIASPYENPHYVQPKPSFAPLLAGADLFVTTGLDLELWVPALLDKASNPKITEGGVGYVAASAGVPLLDVPTSYSRTQGDIHVFGNPHIWTAPLNAIIIARNILTGLKRVDPANAEYFAGREQVFEDRVYRALYGDELVKLLGGATLATLDRQGKLFEFLSGHQYGGAPLTARLGGWLKQGLPFRGKPVVCYHKEWDYFSREFDVPCVDYIEPKPGIPPTPSHVREVIDEIKEQRIAVLLSTSYYDREQVREVAARTGATAVIVAGNAGGEPGTESYVGLVSLWVGALARGFAATPPSPQP